MECFHCKRPAMFTWGSQKQGSIPLCLECQLKVQQILDSQIENDERMIDYLGQQIELTAGIPGLAAHFPPRERPAMIAPGGISVTHLNVTGSNIGILNTGQIGSVDSAVGRLQSSGDTATAEAFRQFTEAIIRLQDVGAAEKNKLLELLSLLAAEATLPDAGRRKGAMLSLLAEVGSICSGVAGLASLYAKFALALQEVFG